MWFLNQMPQTILECIASHLPLESFRNTRLTCRAARHGTARVFGDRFFQKCGVMISKASLQHLVDISLNPCLAPSVRVIELSTLRIPDYVDPFTYYNYNKQRIISRVKEMQNSNVVDDVCEAFFSAIPRITRPVHLQHYKAQRNLVHDGTAVISLTKALKKLPNCTRIVLTDREGWGAQKLARECGTPLLVDFFSPKPLFTLTLWVSTLYALSNAHSRTVTEVGIDFKYEVSERLKLLTFQALCRRRADLERSLYIGSHMRPALDNITTLNLVGVPCHSTWWGGSIVRLIGHFPQLSNCSINFGCFGEHGAIRELSEELFIPRIKVLAISMFSIQEQVLYRLLSRHRHTLRHVGLGSMTVTGDGSWYSLLMQLSKDMEGLVLCLEKARYGTTLVTRRILRFHANGGRTSR